MGNCLCAIFQSGSTSNNNSYQSRLQVSNDDDSYPDGHILAISNLIKFSFKELKIATRNFKPDTVMGKGCFGEVFKGWLDEKQHPRRRGDMTSRTAVAIKRLDLEYVQDSEEWQTEIEFLGRLSHPNLVKFLGYCSKNSQCLLVYEYVQRGSLENHLFGRGSIVQPLPWELRIKIAIGAARAFVFLVEFDDRVICRHIKPSNILLDEAYNVKISDFGLAKLSPSRPNDVVMHLCSLQYIAPEYREIGHVYMKSDVYSFGVVLVELLTGSRASERKTSVSVSNWMKPYLLDKRMLISIMDSKLGNYPLKAAMETAKLAFNCLALELETRPSMNEVLDTLERIQAIH